MSPTPQRLHWTHMVVLFALVSLMSDLSSAAQRPLNWNLLAAGEDEVMENQLSATDFARANGSEVVALTVPQLENKHLEGRLIGEIAAGAFGLVDRGLLKTGWNADIVVLDPETVGSGPVYMKNDLPCNEPRIYADAFGIDHVFVNGVQTVKDGVHTNEMPGKVLRSGQDTKTPQMRRAG